MKLTACPIYLQILVFKEIKAPLLEGKDEGKD
jgi:hypothetical protein